MTILAPVCQRKPRRILKSIRGAMDDLCDHGEGFHGPGADSRCKEQLLEISGPLLGRRSQCSMEPPDKHIA